MSQRSSGLSDASPRPQDKAPGPDRAILVGTDFGSPDFEAAFEELYELALSAGAVVVERMTARRDRPDAKFFIGSGKVDEIAAVVENLEADLVIFNDPLSPGQQRNLEAVTKVRVIDRTSLILDIFAQRAKTHEGRIQVELAQLSHLATRLVRGWTHLERQKGGIGLRGPGETQLETDRRLLGDRVKALKTRLEKLKAQRHTQRRSRERNGTFSVSLIGYTNAGKSTLFNALTKADAYSADQLFATLDTTTRKVWIEGAGQVVMSDTVGFIRQLPHQLVESFKATLEETLDADLLLHVVDAASESRHVQMAAVEAVLAEIGAAAVPGIVVFNKCDLAGLEPQVTRDVHGTIERVNVSALTGAGLDLLRDLIADRAKARRADSNPVDLNQTDLNQLDGVDSDSGNSPQISTLS